MKAALLGIGLLGPGLSSWAASREILAGRAAHVAERTVLQPPARLASTERRRAGDSIKVAMAVADEALGMSGLDPKSVATVFSSSSGEGANCHAICEALAGADRLISPTRFTNSVHNAPAGYWHIATASRAPSTSLCAFDDGFAAGLLEAIAQLHASGAPTLLVASDAPYPQPLHAKRPLPDACGVALLLAPPGVPGALATLELGLARPGAAPRGTPCRGASIEALRLQVPAARALPLLQHLAGADIDASITIAYRDALQLRVDVVAAAAPADSRA